jgi:hypothetical protein
MTTRYGEDAVHSFVPLRPSGPKLATRALLLSFNRAQATVVIGLLTGNKNLGKTFICDGAE